MFELKVLESVFQSALVVESEIAQFPEFMAVVPASLKAVLKNSKPVIVMGPEN